MFWKKYKLNSDYTCSESCIATDLFRNVCLKFDCCVAAVNLLNPDDPEVAKAFRKEAIDELVSWFGPSMSHL